VGLRLIWHDLRRCVRGLVAFRRYLRSRDPIDVALGLFEAASTTVTAGQPCRYVIRIANVSDKVRDVNVTLQMSPMAAATVPAQPSASFSKRYTVQPRRATAVECYYDWRTTAVFMDDTMASPPDECRQGVVETSQRYVVSAILRDRTGRHLDQLNIYQELHR
jgi:hypothetical protein